jgi:hypothetical protein
MCQRDGSRKALTRFSRSEPLLFFQGASQLYSRGWVAPVADPLLLRISGSAGNRTRTSGSAARSFDHWTTEEVVKTLTVKIKVKLEDGSVIYCCCWFSPAQSRSGLSREGPNAILYCPNSWDYPNLEGQIPVFISPRNRVAQIYPRALDSLFVASYDSQG